ncbi:hypothetical protein ACH5RR_036933 [Cinchona calisaya]|uniref:Uncharacterized protein n=1 Tax=Cinchona calisaya TaxID=153742 RepID=A0ABD2Y4P4_9GENT
MFTIKEFQKHIGRFLFETRIHIKATKSSRFMRMTNANLRYEDTANAIPSWEDLRGWMLLEGTPKQRKKHDVSQITTKVPAKKKSKVQWQPIKIHEVGRSGVEKEIPSKENQAKVQQLPLIPVAQGKNLEETVVDVAPQEPPV